VREPMTIRTAPRVDATHKIRKWSLHMTIGMFFYILAAIVLFLGGIGATVIPNHITWGLFCVALGLALDDVGFGSFRRR
jgi:predicted permease